MKPSHGHDEEGQNQSTAPSGNPPAAGRGTHYVPPITIGPIPGLPLKEFVPPPPEPTIKEQLEAAWAAMAEERHEEASDFEGLATDEGPPTEDSFPLNLEPYTGPPDRPIPVPSTPWPSAMVGDANETPEQLWHRICEIAKQKRIAVPQAESDILWLVKCDRQAKLMILVAEEEFLAQYIDGIKACPVTISGAKSYITIEGGAQSIAGYARHAAAASTIGRLAYPREVVAGNGQGWKDHWKDQARLALD